MEIEKIKEAREKVNKLEKIRNQLRLLNNSNDVDSLEIKRTNLKESNNTYCITLTEDKKFLKTIKALIVHKLKREEEQLVNELDKL
jgi:hypothetical protein